MIKDTFDIPLTEDNYGLTQDIIDQASKSQVKKLFTIGTSIIESKNCLALAQKYKNIYAVIGIHPNDLPNEWKTAIKELKKLLAQNHTTKIIALGECGLDFHYPNYNKQQQYDGFKAQIELALEHNLPLVIHTRDAGDETLRCLEAYKDTTLRGTIHCFSEGLTFAQDAINIGFVLGIGGTITYPKNNTLREVVNIVGLDNIILETDAPYLAPQAVRGTKNSPKNIKLIAEYIALMLNESLETVANKTTQNVHRIFGSLAE
jgi:TatD DNase family protein